MKSISCISLAVLLLWACEAPRQKNGENILSSGIKFKVISRDAKGKKSENRRLPGDALYQ
jgi:hypothetical protein